MDKTEKAINRIESLRPKCAQKQWKLLLRMNPTEMNLLPGKRKGLSGNDVTRKYTHAEKKTNEFKSNGFL